MTRNHGDAAAVVETRIVHDSQRRATSLLVDVVTDPRARAAAVVELRDFIAAALEHHHESEDRDLWPLLRAAVPELGEGLDALSGEHARLDAALEELQSAPVGSPGDPRAVAAAVAVRDLVHEHLSHEGPLLFPALRAQLSEDDWAGFSRRTVESAPQTGTHLLVEMLYEAGSTDEVDLILRHLPAEARQALPAIRKQARSTLADLRSSSDPVR